MRAGHLLIASTLLLSAFVSALPQGTANVPKADAPKADAPKADAAKADPPKADAPKADAAKPADAKPPAAPTAAAAAATTAATTAAVKEAVKAATGGDGKIHLSFKVPPEAELADAIKYAAEAKSDFKTEDDLKKLIGTKDCKKFTTALFISRYCFNQLSVPGKKPEEIANDLHLQLKALRNKVAEKAAEKAADKKPDDKKDAPKKEDAKKEEPKKEEPKKEEPKKEEAKKDAPKKEEPKKDEPKKEDKPKLFRRNKDNLPQQLLMCAARIGHKFKKDGVFVEIEVDGKKDKNSGGRYAFAALVYNDRSRFDTAKLAEKAKDHKKTATEFCEHGKKYSEAKFSFTPDELKEVAKKLDAAPAADKKPAATDKPADKPADKAADKKDEPKKDEKKA